MRQTGNRTERRVSNDQTDDAMHRSMDTLIVTEQKHKIKARAHIMLTLFLFYFIFEKNQVPSKVKKSEKNRKF